MIDGLISRASAVAAATLLLGNSAEIVAAERFILTIEEIECPDGSTSAVRARWSAGQSIPVIPDGDSWILLLGDAEPPLAVYHSPYGFSQNWLDPEDGTAKNVTIVWTDEWRFTTDQNAEAGVPLGTLVEAGSIGYDEFLNILYVDTTVVELDDSDCDGIPDIEDSPEASDLIRALIVDVDSVPNLHHGIKNALTAKLNGALSALNSGQSASACEKLQDFINQCRAQQGKKLTNEGAASLIEKARVIRGLLNCR